MGNVEVIATPFSRIGIKLGVEIVSEFDYVKSFPEPVNQSKKEMIGMRRKSSQNPMNRCARFPRDPGLILTLTSFLHFFKMFKHAC